jgi:hypothetical protein
MSQQANVKCVWVLEVMLQQTYMFQMCRTAAMCLGSPNCIYWPTDWIF